MSTPENDTSDLGDFLKELDSDFGKKGKGYKSGKSDTLKTARGPRDASEINYASFAKRQLAQYLTEGDPTEVGTKPYEPKPSWIPLARVTYVIRQNCKCCGDQVSFIGGEYIKFKSTRSHAEITRRAEVCSDLWHYLPDSGDPLPDLVDELDQDVARCPGCIKVEQQALDIWVQATEAPVQVDAFDGPQRAKQQTALNGNQLKAYVQRDFGTRFKKPEAKLQEIDIDLPGFDVETR